MLADMWERRPSVSSLVVDSREFPQLKIDSVEGAEMSTETDGRDPHGTVAGDGPAERELEISARVMEINDQRAFIEQAKGMLMFIYGVDGDAAFQMLRTQSQHHNVKLRLLAEQIVKDLVALSDPTSLERRVRYDELLTTAHQRIEHAAVRQLDGANKTGD
jgi:ANTAR domain